MEKEWFKDWFNSPYYHQLYFNRDEVEAAAFIDKIVSYLKPDGGSRMLDVACGKGRHSMHLAAKGFDVTGIDLSVDSIKAASENEKENLHFYCHDMRLLFWINYFDVVFNLFTSFGYFATERENDDAIRTMATALKPGGILVVDYLNTAYAVAHSVPSETKQIDGVNFLINKWNDATHFYKKIEIANESLSEPFIYTERVSKFSLSDFEKMFNHHGLRLKFIFGNYQLENYDEQLSPRMVLIAEKI